MLVKLNIGAGRNLLSKEDGWLNIDAMQWDDKIDLVIDLEKRDFPYEDDSIDEIRMLDFLEHLSLRRQIPFLRECFRVMKMGAKIFIQVPDMGVAAKRYCGVLENPTKLQHNVDGIKLAEMTYGGQDYDYNFHKWGYDQKSLTDRLKKIGFSVWWTRSDGGMNMHCFGAKPFTKVLIPVGGGLGDVFQTYLASPSSVKVYEDDALPPDEFPSSDAGTSMWLKRLKALRTDYPDLYIKGIVKSSNPSALALFTENPYLDEVEEWDYREVLPEGYWYNYEKDGWRCITRAEYMVENYEPDLVEFYTEADQQDVVDTVKKLTPYIVFQPTAGVPEREPIDMSQYLEIARLVVSELHCNVVLLGSRTAKRYQEVRIMDLTGQTSPSASMQIVLNSSGFIGTHSCMVLCAWYARIPSVCIVPPFHDGGQPWAEFFALENNPTVWGAHKPFNRTIVVDNADEFKTEQAIEAIKEAGLERNSV